MAARELRGNQRAIAALVGRREHRRRSVECATTPTARATG